jgi:hypothetical protein
MTVAFHPPGVISHALRWSADVTTFDDREKGFESKFAFDQELEFKAIARRNRLMGRWAGELMGLEGDHLEEYAKAVVRADFEQPGDEDVIRKVKQDLEAAGIETRESQIRQKMDEMLAQAREAIKTGA